MNHDWKPLQFDKEGKPLGKFEQWVCTVCTAELHPSIRTERIGPASCLPGTSLPVSDDCTQAQYQIAYVNEAIDTRQKEILQLRSGLTEVWYLLETGLPKWQIRERIAVLLGLPPSTTPPR